jgi:high-affinity nickel permease
MPVGNVCYKWCRFLSSSLLSKNIKITIYGIIILPVLYACEWSLISREEHRLRVFEIGVLRRIFGPRRDKVTRE